jgi:hypothetical protein
MAKSKDPLVLALLEGRSFTWTVPEGGDFASMRAAIKHGQTLTMSPVADFHEVQPGDIVLLKWRGGGYIMHLVQEVRGDQFLIVNSLGKVNGWAPGSDILGRVTRIVEPEPRPEPAAMWDQLEGAYRVLIEQNGLPEDDARRLLSIAADLRWYAARLGAERWDRQPKQNKWSLAQNVWLLTRQARQAAAHPAEQPIEVVFDSGKACVGLAAQIAILFERPDSEWAEA